MVVSSRNGILIDCAEIVIISSCMFVAVGNLRDIEAVCFPLSEILESPSSAFSPGGNRGGISDQRIESAIRVAGQCMVQIVHAAVVAPKLKIAVIRRVSRERSHPDIRHAFTGR